MKTSQGHELLDAWESSFEVQLEVLRREFEAKLKAMKDTARATVVAAIEAQEAQAGIDQAQTARRKG